MPPRRVNRRTRFKRKNFRRSTISNLSRRISGLARAAAPEKKYLDLTANAQAMASTASLVLLNGMVIGNSGSTREGQSINLLYSWLQFDIICNTTSVGSVVRMMLVYDKQPNGAAFTAANLLVTNTNLNSPFVIGYGHRFRVLWDRRYALSAVGGNYQIIKRVFKKMFLKTTFNTGDAGTVADIATGSLYLFYISDEATNTPTLSYYHRLRYSG